MIFLKEFGRNLVGIMVLSALMLAAVGIVVGLILLALFLFGSTIGPYVLAVLVFLLIIAGFTWVDTKQKGML